MMSCIFCQIANQEIKAELTYQDHLVVAFKDLAPQAPVHQLIIPRLHIKTLNDLKQEESSLIGHMVYIAQQLASENKLTDRGYRIVSNCNSEGGQNVFHIHLHLLGGRQMNWPPG